MNPLINTLKEKFDKSKLDSELKAWLINQLNFGQENFIYTFYYEDQNSEFSKNSLADIDRKFSSSIKVKKINNFSDVKLLGKYNFLDLASKLTDDQLDQIKRNATADTKLVLIGDFEQNLDKSLSTILVNRNKSLSIRSLIRKLELENEIQQNVNLTLTKVKSKFNLLLNRIDLQSTEINAKIYDLKQQEIGGSARSEKSLDDSRDIKSKLKQQENIFVRSVNRSLDEYFGEDSDLKIHLTRVVNSIEELKENLKEKKNQLLIPDEIIETIESEFQKTSSAFWANNLEMLNKYYVRNNSYVAGELKAKNLSSNLRAKINSEVDKHKDIYKQSVNYELEKVNTEITKKRVGDYLMKARMFPMYILMGSSMLGLSVNRGNAAKYIAPFMIFLMGVGFYMIYISRQKEEKDEKEKALIIIKEKVIAEIGKRCKDFSTSSKNFFEKEVKQNNDNLFSFYEKSINLNDQSGVSNTKSPARHTTRKKTNYENLLRELTDIKKEIVRTSERLK